MSEVDVSKCGYYYPKYCNSEKYICGTVVELSNQLQQLKEHCKQVDETNKILYQEKCDLVSDNLATIQELDNERRRNEAYKQSEEEAKEIIAELKARLDEYEKDGGALDEGQAWANEAMASRNEISKLNKCLDGIEHILEINKRELDECLFNDIDGEILQLIEQVRKGAK